MHDRPGATGSYGRHRIEVRISVLSSQKCLCLVMNAGCFRHRQKPYVIRSPRRRLAVEVQLQNRLENAYNTSLTLHYSRNLHFSSLSIRVQNPPLAYSAPLRI